jgi:transcriptional regulator with XRE-family HTH domain
MHLAESIRYSSSERPRYTRYEMGEELYQKRINLGKSIEQVSKEYSISVEKLNFMEEGKIALSFKDYKFLSEFTSIPFEELMSSQIDSAMLSFRTKDEKDSSILEAIELADNIFNDFVMQAKINTGLSRGVNN